MKAASLVLLTAAWMASDHHTTSAPCHGCQSSGVVYHSSGDGCCDSCGRESFFDRIRNRLGGLFNRGDCCDPCHGTVIQDSCCDPCAGSGWRFGDRLRGLFRRGNDCCNSCDCCTPSWGTPHYHPHPGPHGETIPIPAPKDGAKKMPNAPTEGGQVNPGKTSIQPEPPIGLNTIPSGNPVTGTIPVTDPNIGFVPPTAPSIPGNPYRRPF